MTVVTLKWPDNQVLREVHAVLLLWLLTQLHEFTRIKFISDAYI